MTFNLVLASNSPRRKELLALGGWLFQGRPVEVDESPLAGEAPPVYVSRLAQAKAVAADRGAADEVIVAADTTVVDGGEILGKPGDALQAAAMLRQLRGHTHQVYTALVVLRSRDHRLLTDLCRTDVPMRDYHEDEIQAYVASGDPMDKAGAYAIQHRGFDPVPYLSGCYANVVGLPLCHLARTLRKIGIPPAADLPQACQSALQYHCPVYPQVLAGELAVEM